MESIKIYLLLLLINYGNLYKLPEQCEIDQQRRIDCFPESYPYTEEHCVERGCCYMPTFLDKNDDSPWCFFPTDYGTYKLISTSTTPTGTEGVLVLDYKNKTRHYMEEVPKLSLTVKHETESRLRIQIRDASKQRFEVPIETPSDSFSGETLYSVTYSVYGLMVTRKSTGVVLLNTTIAPLIYANQFLQMSTSLASPHLFGLGERHANAQVSTSWKRLIFWARDQAPQDNKNLYGDHPFYINIEQDGNSHGVFLLNSNAKEIDILPAPALTWRTIGGILDFYVMLGPTPDNVVQQYTDVVGKTFMPPYWSLGFHLCRWGYNSSEQTLDIVTRMREASIPQDVQWNDIDYMDSRLDFTYNHVNYNTLPQMLDNLHHNGQHYVMIIDPGISNLQAPGTYPAYDDGISLGIFVNNSDNSHPIRGIVWPGETVFPDYTHPNIQQYWEKQLQVYHDKVPFDGVWIDMNEPSNFLHGSVSGCPKNNLENPPYVPRVTGGSLASRTLCMSANHHNNTHYNLHSLTGLFEMKATSEALIKIRNKRPFVISRSTFPSSGKYGGHWSGDIRSTWADLKQSITSVINFNMFGIPMVGADICGFGGETNEELCTRWMQTGAFYPFMRNHNDLVMKGQSPVEFSISAQDSMRKALLARYTFLPYLYTLFHNSHLTGTTVARGLFFEFPRDQKTLAIDEQLMWGSALLISPVLTEKATTVNGYFPPGTWYELSPDFGKTIQSAGEYFQLDAPLDVIPLHLRSGFIIPGQFPETTTTESRKNPFLLLVAPDKSGNANGELYWDDGDSLNTFESGDYLLVKFQLVGNKLKSVVEKASSYSTKLNEISIFSYLSKPTSINVDGKSVPFEITSNNVLIIHCNIDLNIALNVEIILK